MASRAKVEQSEIPKQACTPKMSVQNLSFAFLANLVADAQERQNTAWEQGHPGCL